MWEPSSAAAAAAAHYMPQQPQQPVQSPMDGRAQPPPHYQVPQSHMQQTQSGPPPQQHPGMQPHPQHQLAPQAMPQQSSGSHGHSQQKPRGKMTPYACFVKVIRAEHKKKHPNESIVFSEFSKKCAEKWRQMTDKEKRRFQEMAEKDKERYESEMQHYQPPDGQPKGKPKKRKKPKDPDAPKRALSAFMWFCKDFRHEVKEKNPEMRMGEIAKVLSVQWKTAANKEFYENRANEDKNRYADAMKIFRATKGVGPHGGKVTNAQARAAIPLQQQQQHQAAQQASQQPPNPAMMAQNAGVPQQMAAGLQGPGPGQYGVAQDLSGPPVAKKPRTESTSSSSGSGTGSSDSSSDSEAEGEHE